MTVKPIHHALTLHVNDDENDPYRIRYTTCRRCRMNKFQAMAQIMSLLNRDDLLRVLQRQRRYRPRHSDPTFGSGGFGRGTVWGGGVGDLGDIIGGLGRGGGFGRRGGGGGGYGGGGGGHCEPNEYIREGGP